MLMHQDIVSREMRLPKNLSLPLLRSDKVIRQCFFVSQYWDTPPKPSLKYQQEHRETQRIEREDFKNSFLFGGRNLSCPWVLFQDGFQDQQGPFPVSNVQWQFTAVSRKFVRAVEKSSYLQHTASVLFLN
uniref:Uncharacterized protein n=1 Tax=Pseudictyota dubia TaxID=2749911 RepID=A0A7R9WC01_9STRA|mmetsp:Transcript_43060/g.79893  ORF Transcript_43060/g.79893 Transcript_43060/m.79893 type:complete len:130 (+) Transcript_43060:259-648(+)